VRFVSGSTEHFLAHHPSTPWRLLSLLISIPVCGGVAISSGVPLMPITVVREVPFLDYTLWARIGALGMSLTVFVAIEVLAILAIRRQWTTERKITVEFLLLASLTPLWIALAPWLALTGLSRPDELDPGVQIDWPTRTGISLLGSDHTWGRRDVVASNARLVRTG
jgi:hypothetical protein